ncbi:MAG TPA: HAD family hydrolase [Puia sp.]|nr:HAD family hydrolase [Puia sp.]
MLQRILAHTGLALLTISLLSMGSCNTPDNKGNATDSTATASKDSLTATDPLPSWNDGATKKALLNFVSAATQTGGQSFIPESDRIAVFDNDGTLWSEQPLYFQFFFAFDRIKQMAPQHPQWKNQEPYKSLLNGNMKGVMATGEKGLIALMATTFAGMNSEEFNNQVSAWADTAKNPVTGKRYIDMIFQPMLELLNLLRANGFKTFIVSGGDIDFMRAWAGKVYGIPPPQVIGSSLKSSFAVKHDSVSIMRLPQMNFIDDGPGKPVGIYQHIGIKPVFAAGNSDGDYQMLQWTYSNTLPHLGIIVHHTDSAREWKYDRGSPIGKLEKGLDDAGKYGWILVDMKNDWKKIFPYN